MDYDAIAAELTKPEYAGMKDAAIADALMAKAVPHGAPIVPIVDITNYLRTAGLWLPIKTAAAAGTSVGAMAAVDLNEDLRARTIDLSLPIVGEMLADLVAQKLLSQEQSDTITAMAAAPFARNADETISADVIARAKIG